MRKRLTVTAALLAPAATLLSASAVLASPQIEKTIPNTNCGLNAYEPGLPPGGTVNGDGLIDCNGTKYHLQIEACVQSSPNGSSDWTDQKCDLVPASGTTYTSSLGSYPVASEKSSTWYRTWAFGYANGNSATVASDPEYSH